MQETCDFYAKPPRSNGLCPNPRSRTWGVWSLSTNAEVLQSWIPLHMHRDLFDMHFPSTPVMQQRQESRAHFCIVNVSTHVVRKEHAWDTSSEILPWSDVVFVQVLQHAQVSARLNPSILFSSACCTGYDSINESAEMVFLTLFFF